ncbi:hypothetical protein P0F65_02945 [Sphingomonas sp. I4]
MRHLTRGEIADQAEDAARDLRDELAGLWRGGGQAAVRAGVERRLNTDRVPLSVILLTDARGRFVTGNIAEWPPNVPAPVRPRSRSSASAIRSPSGCACWRCSCPTVRGYWPGMSSKASCASPWRWRRRWRSVWRRRSSWPPSPPGPPRG